LLGPQRSGKFAFPAKVKKQKKAVDDDARFLKSWLENPLIAGAVAPSGRDLALKMASAIDPAMPGPIIELGPGTGPVTQALIERGVAPERLVLIEYSADFAALLRHRFPGVTVVRGDAYALRSVLAPLDLPPAAAVVSSLPLLTKPEKVRTQLLKDAFLMLSPGCPFVQFTYMPNSPVPLDRTFLASGSRRVWKNLPPARVWTYRRPTV
jgi:phosphatidylethanolamine/phosphatidyl-N-methylethanolamine N-methyltransferase